MYSCYAEESYQIFSSFEDENKFEEALKSYENCLALIPFHEEAQNSIEFLKTKILNSTKLSDADVSIPGLASKTLEVKETLKQLLKGEDDDDKKDKDKERSKSAPFHSFPFCFKISCIPSSSVCWDQRITHRLPKSHLWHSKYFT